MGELSKFNFRVLWTFVGDQSDLESTFPINSMHTSILIMYPHIKRCSGLKGDGKFSYRSIKEFTADAFQFRTKQFILPQIMPLINYVDPWTEDMFVEEEPLEESGKIDL